ncbi:MAG: response regulator [Deltaproteobacteria bacterium]|nr:response regulator [Deltaproteobacteria bacterium]
MDYSTRKEKILLVDDEPNVLAGYVRGLRQRYNVFTAEGGVKGLETIEESGPFAVIVADMRMPVMDGVKFLKKVKRIAPESTRMMLTGNADQETAMQAVNVGAIFRFLTKPCPATDLLAALALGVRQYRLVTAEKEIMEKTLSGSIKLLTELLSISEPVLIAKAEKIRDYVQLTSKILEVENAWELEVAAMMAPLGALTQPPELRQKMRDIATLSEAEKDAVMDIPELSGRLLAHIPRMENISRLTAVAAGIPEIEYSSQQVDTLPFDIKVMKTLADLVELELRGMSDKDAFGVLRTRNTIYDITITQRIEQILEEYKVKQAMENMQCLEVRVKHLINGDILNQNVESQDERLLLSKGTKITDVYLARLHNYRRLVGIQEPIQILRRKFEIKPH